LFPDNDEWLNPGDSVIVAPGGDIVSGPLHEEHGVLTADIDLGRVPSAHRTLDVAGHYSRTDIFQLIVNRKASDPITYTPE
jgi:nitrilase